MSNTPFQVHGINEFKKETMKNQKYKKGIVETMPGTCYATYMSFKLLF